MDDGLRKGQGQASAKGEVVTGLLTGTFKRPWHGWVKMSRTVGRGGGP
jgi:hypothetical protein